MLGMESSESDILALVTCLRRAALVRLSKALGAPLTGLAVAGRRLPLTPRWRRKLRELDSTLGIIEKITPASVNAFLAELDAALEVPVAPSGASSKKIGADSEDSEGVGPELPPSAARGSKASQSATPRRKPDSLDLRRSAAAGRLEIAKAQRETDREISEQKLAGLFEIVSAKSDKTTVEVFEAAPFRGQDGQWEVAGKKRARRADTDALPRATETWRRKRDQDKHWGSDGWTKKAGSHKSREERGQKAWQGMWEVSKPTKHRATRWETAQVAADLAAKTWEGQRQQRSEECRQPALLQQAPYALTCESVLPSALPAAGENKSKGDCEQQGFPQDAAPALPCEIQLGDSREEVGASGVSFPVGAEAPDLPDDRAPSLPEPKKKQGGKGRARTTTKGKTTRDMDDESILDEVFSAAVIETIGILHAGELRCENSHMMEADNASTSLVCDCCNSQICAGAVFTHCVEVGCDSSGPYCRDCSLSACTVLAK